MARRGECSTRQSVMNFVNCILGASVLGYPYSYRTSGLVLGTLLMLVSFVATRISYQLLLYCSQLSSRRSYEDLAEQACGKLGRQLLELCIAGMNLGCMIAYLNILADVLSSVAGTIIPPGAEPSRAIYLVGVTVFGAFPVSMIVRDHSLLAAFSKVSVLFMVIFSGVIFIFACSPSLADPRSREVALRMWKPDGAMIAFPMMAYSFTAHPYFLGIYTNLQDSTPQRMASVTTLGMTAAAFIYWLVGVCGYISFKDRTAGDLLRNFGASHVGGVRGAYERAIKLCYGLSILGSIPLVVLPFYNILLPMLGYDLTPGAARGVAEPTTVRKHRYSDSDDDGPHTDSSSDLNPTGVVASGRTMSSEGSTTGASTSSKPRGVRSLQHTHSLDVVDLRLQHDGLHSGPSAASGDILATIKPAQHTLVVLMVLSLSMAAAIYIPNVEFIFGITGATASVLLAFVIPSLTFIRLLDHSPELTVPSKTNMIPEEVRATWVWRRRLAVGVLIFGLIVGVCCTDAILSAVKEENAVVELAQQLVAHEVVVTDTARVQIKANEAIAAVTVVETASKQLDAAQVNASQTLGELQMAANALSSITQRKNMAPEAPHHFWDVHHALEKHNQHATDTKVLRSVEVLLIKVKEDAHQTLKSVTVVVGQLDAAIAKLKAQEAMRHGNTTSSLPVGTNNSASVAATANSAFTTSGTTTGGGADGGKVEADEEGEEEGEGEEPSRAANLAMELGKALGVFAEVQPNATAGKSLMDVRSSALAAAAALNQTVQILDRVSLAVALATSGHKHSNQVREAAVAAMQAALNASATSALAVKLTTEALQKTADDETDELLTLLTKVANDLQRKMNNGNPSLDKILSFGSDTAEGIDTSSGSEGGSKGGGGGKVDMMDRTDGGTAADAAVDGDVVGAKGGSGEAAVGHGDVGDSSDGKEGSDTAGDKTNDSSTVVIATTDASASANADSIRETSRGGSSKGSSESSSGSSSTEKDQAGDTSKGDESKEDADRLENLKKVIENLSALRDFDANTTRTASTATTRQGATDVGGKGVVSDRQDATSDNADSAAADSSTGDASATSATDAVSVATAAAAAAVRGGVAAGGGTYAGNTTADAAADHVAKQLVSHLLNEAVKWTQGSQAGNMKALQETLGKADAKVQSRVMEIMKDMNEKKDQKAAKNAAQGLLDTNNTIQASNTSHDDASVTGPVVLLTLNGELVQKDMSSSPSPIATVKEHAHTAAKTAAAAADTGTRVVSGKAGSDSSAATAGSTTVGGQKGGSLLTEGAAEGSDGEQGAAAGEKELNRKISLGKG